MSETGVLLNNFSRRRYELPSAFATRFAFSRFGESLLPPSANAADGEALHDDSSGNAVLEAAVGELEEPGR